jgi:hypothetical protein
MTAVVATNTLTVSRLELKVGYEWRVSAACGTLLSDWSDVCSFNSSIAGSGSCATEEPTCEDGIKNQGEEDVDCGGPCVACPTCGDGLQNQGETGVDCGGPCTPCATCDDGIQNQGETGKDCGGPCPACITCDDGLQNGSEEGIDCGGDCAPCVVCAVPNNLALGLNGASAKFTWTAVESAFGYVLELRDRINNTLVRYELTSNVYTGRLPNVRNYDAWRVATRCTEEVQSEWSEWSFFPVRRTGELATPGDFTLYPNPVQSVLSLVFDPVPQTLTRFLVIDLNGKPVVSGEVKPGTTEATIDLSLLNPGVYILQVKSDHLFGVRRFVVQRE